MTRISLLRRARALIEIIERETTPPGEAAAARQRLEEMRVKHKISDIELASLDREAQRSVPLQAAAIRCPAMLHDFVGVVLAAAGGGLRPAGEDNALVLARPADLARLQRLAERLTLLLIEEAGRRAERSHAIGRAFCATSFWAGIVRRIAERLTPAGGEPGPAASAAARPGPGQPEESQGPPPAQPPGLVLYVEPDPEQRRSRQIVIVNPDDAAAGESIGDRFALEVSGDIDAPAGPAAAGPSAKAEESAADRLARSVRWLRSCGLKLEDCPVISLFVGSILGGAKSSAVTNTWVSWLWQQWSERARQIQLSSAREVRQLRGQLSPPIESPHGMLIEQDHQALERWARAVAPRLWGLDRELGAAREAAAARQRAEEEERLRKMRERGGGASVWTTFDPFAFGVMFRSESRPPPETVKAEPADPLRAEMTRSLA